MSFSCVGGVGGWNLHRCPIHSYVSHHRHGCRWGRGRGEGYDEGSFDRRSLLGSMTRVTGEDDVRSWEEDESGGVTYGVFSNPHAFRRDGYVPRPFPQYHQRRWMGRKDGLKAFYRVRPATKKQRKRRNERLKAHRLRLERHSRPGSKAGIRRQTESEMRRDVLENAEQSRYSKDELDYDFGDALVDDLVGNTSLTTPDPRPSAEGHRYEARRRRLESKLRAYHRIDGQSTTAAAPPTDREISSALRSYRDLNASYALPSSSDDAAMTRRRYRRALGLRRAVTWLVSECDVPRDLWGETTYTTLMTCASSPQECRQVRRWMHERHLLDDPHSSASRYACAILVDHYAKRGDFRGARRVMLRPDDDDDDIDATTWRTVDPLGSRVRPPMAAYTSLLAACAAAVRHGAVFPPRLKAEAGDLAWECWMEMRVWGTANDDGAEGPDVMAYGSLMGVLAARGLAEKALDVLEEMERMGVRPTTLVFTEALRAVARSHAIAIRFRGGLRRRERRRQSICAHHGRMARRIVVLAERADANVNDDAFVAALVLCAAHAGDATTAKAVFLASEVRKLDTLRTTGSDYHLETLRTLHRNHHHDTNRTSLPSSSSLEPTQSSPPPPDTRVYTALLSSYARAMSRGGLGDLWSGVGDRGCFDEGTLDRIVAWIKPRYVDKSIPGLNSTQVGLAAATFGDDKDADDDDLQDRAQTMSKRERRKPFRYEQDTFGNTPDELEEPFYTMIHTQHPLGYDATLVEGDATDDQQHTKIIADDTNPTHTNHDIDASHDDDDIDDVERMIGHSITYDTTTGEIVHSDGQSSTTSPQTPPSPPTTHDDPTNTPQYYFDDNVMRWKTRTESSSPSSTTTTNHTPPITTTTPTTTSHSSTPQETFTPTTTHTKDGSDDDDEDDDDDNNEDNEDDAMMSLHDHWDAVAPELESNDFDSFYDALLEEAADMTQHHNDDPSSPHLPIPTRHEAKQLFDAMRHAHMRAKNHNNNNDTTSNVIDEEKEFRQMLETEIDFGRQGSDDDDDKEKDHTKKKKNIQEEDFESFYEGMRSEMTDHPDVMDEVTKKEARLLFRMMKDAGRHGGGVAKEDDDDDQDLESLMKHMMMNDDTNDDHNKAIQDEDLESLVKQMMTNDDTNDDNEQHTDDAFFRQMMKNAESSSSSNDDEDTNDQSTVDAEQTFFDRMMKEPSSSLMDDDNDKKKRHDLFAGLEGTNLDKLDLKSLVDDDDDYNENKDDTNAKATQDDAMTFYQDNVSSSHHNNDNNHHHDTSDDDHHHPSLSSLSWWKETGMTKNDENDRYNPSSHPFFHDPPLHSPPPHET